jgi:hypothetical protein
MKTSLLVVACAMGAMMLAGCAAHETTNTTTANPARRTYGSSELRKTGQPDTAGAIEAADPGAITH